jgi:SAM-dependent methyltransferase
MSISKDTMAARPFAARFADVDASDPVACAAFLDVAHSLEGVRRSKLVSFDLLGILNGDRILDLGCGTGADVITLARLIGINGRIVGVDYSRTLVKLAQKRAGPLGLPVTFVQADIHRLPFENESFDRTRIDRVLHFLPEPGRAIQEAVRVTRQDGRIVVTEPDWRTLTVEGGDDRLGAAILTASTMRPGSATAAQLPEIMRDAGLHVDAYRDATLEIREYRIAAMLFGLEMIASRAVGESRVSPTEAVGWLRSLQHASIRSALRCALTGAIVSGTRI